MSNNMAKRETERSNIKATTLYPRNSDKMKQTAETAQTSKILIINCFGLLSLFSKRFVTAIREFHCKITLNFINQLKIRNIKVALYELKMTFPISNTLEKLEISSVWICISKPTGKSLHGQFIKLTLPMKSPLIY